MDIMQIVNGIGVWPLLGSIIIIALFIYGFVGVKHNGGNKGGDE